MSSCQTDPDINFETLCVTNPFKDSGLLLKQLISKTLCYAVASRQRFLPLPPKYPN